MRKTCTSGSVGGEGGNILAYPATFAMGEDIPVFRFAPYGLRTDVRGHTALFESGHPRTIRRRPRGANRNVLRSYAQDMDYPDLSFP